jgi:ATP-dependent helicase/nuclease subunit A
MDRKPMADAEARADAARVFDCNLVVEAGAGTGKTSLLVERIVNAVVVGKTEIDRIAAITFTIKAAGELRKRIAAAFERLLHLAGLPQVPEPDVREEADRAYAYLSSPHGAGLEPEVIARRALGALLRLDRATIETIHSFCAGLLRRHPLEAGVDPGFEVDEGVRFRAVSEACWEAFLARELGREAPRLDLWRTALASFDLATLREVAFGLGGFGVPRRLLVSSPDEAAEGPGVLDAPILDRIEDLRYVLDHARGMTAKSRGILERLLAALEATRQHGPAALRTVLATDSDLAGRVEKGSFPKRNKKLEDVTGDRMEAAGREGMHLARAMASSDDGLLAKLVSLLAPVALETREALLRSGSVGFDTLLVSARDLLRDRPDAREALKDRYRMILVDEFQDTDPLQYEIVLLLGEERGGRADDPFDVRLDPGRLFIVGDAKQSIYRFRGADYGAFTRAVETIVAKGGRRLELVTNFRSRPEVLEPVNVLFEDEANGAWRPSPYQSAYVAVHAPPGRDSTGEPAVELWTVGAGLKAADRRQREGAAIAAEIERAAPDRLRDGEPDFSRFTILLRAFSDLDAYLRPLRDRGIPYIVDGGRGFLERLEVGHLLAVLRALARPSDEAALLAYLRSPVAAVSDVALARYAAAGGRWNWRSPIPDEDRSDVAEAMRRLQSIDRQTAGLPTAEMVRRVLDLSELTCLSGATFEGAQKVANLWKLAAAAGELGRDGRLSLSEILDHLEGEYAPETESDSPLADETNSAVRVLTIHKAKGLENDVVIVPDIARGEGRGSEESVRVATLPTGEARLALKVGGVPNSARVWLDREDTRHDRAESLRLLYVAMTRARERLILVAGQPERGSGTLLDALAPWGFRVEAPPQDGEILPAGVLHRRPGDERSEVRAPSGCSPRGAPEAADAYRVALEAVRGSCRPPFEAPSALATGHDREGHEDSRAEVGGDRDVARTIGTAVHAALAGWDLESDEDLLTRGVNLSRAAMDPGKTSGAVASILRAFLTSPLAGKLREAEVIGRELPMLLRDGDGPAYRGSIDLVYRDADGGVVVADFKTDETEDAAALADRYRGPLTVYARAVQKALGLDRAPATEIWHLRSGRAISVG